MKRELPPESAGWWQHDMEPAPLVSEALRLALAFLLAVAIGALMLLPGLALVYW